MATGLILLLWLIAWISLGVWFRRKDSTLTASMGGGFLVSLIFLAFVLLVGQVFQLLMPKQLATPSSLPSQEILAKLRAESAVKQLESSRYQRKLDELTDRDRMYSEVAQDPVDPELAIQMVQFKNHIYQGTVEQYFAKMIANPAVRDKGWRVRKGDEFFIVEKLLDVNGVNNIWVWRVDMFGEVTPVNDKALEISGRF